MLIYRLKLSPDEPGSSGDPAGDENTDAGQPNDPSSRSDNRDQYVAKGIQIGIERVLKKLGFSDLDSAKEEISSFRGNEPKKPVDDIPDEKQGEFDAKLKEASKENMLLKRELEKRERDLQRYKEQSDEARLMKLRALALEHGVGKGRQLDAFVRLYGDEVAFDDNRDLVVLSKLPDGTMEPMGESVEDFVKKALEKDPYLRPYDSSKGSGSRSRPTSSSQTGSDVSPLAQKVFGNSASSGRNRLFGRRNTNDGS